MNRITDRDIDECCETLNQMLGLPVAPYVNGKPQQGCIHRGHSISAIVQMSLIEGSSAVDLLSVINTKREAWQWLRAAIRGAQLMSDSTKDN